MSASSAIPTIAVYSDADRDALHVEMADEAYRIGPALAADSYLSIGAILEAASRAKATIVHPGYGFLSERAHFASAVADAGLTFIGPPAEAIEMMGDKAAARRAADRVGVPIVPGTPEPVTLDQAPAEAERIGFPVARQGRVRRRGQGDAASCERPSELEERPRRERRARRRRTSAARRCSSSATSSARTTSRRRCSPTRTGNVLFLGERDCSVQRRHQKLIEETPSPVVDDDLASRIGEAAMALAKEAGYVNAGTVECMVDEDGSFYFLEMNTRLQVEHTVTEMVTGLDLVALQIRVALGEKLDLSDVRPTGHAIQCRINAEDPGRNFLPGPGRVTAYVSRPGRSCASTRPCARGGRSPADYDSMFAKLIVSAAGPRAGAIARMLRALAEFHVEGVPTTIPLHRWVLGRARSPSRRTRRRGSRRRSATPSCPRPARRRRPPSDTRQPVPAELLVEVDGRRVPVRIFDERRETAPKAPVASLRATAATTSTA